MDDYFKEKVQRISFSIKWSFLAFLVILIVLLVFIRIEESITTHGIVTFEQSHRIYSPEDGFVSRMAKREGEKVESGEAILFLDDRVAQQQRQSLVNQIAEATANLGLTNAQLEQAKITPLPVEHRFVLNTVKEAEAKVAFNEAEYNRRKGLLTQGVESASNVERAKLDTDLARQGLDRAQQQAGEVGKGLATQALQEAQARYAESQARLQRLEQELAQTDKTIALLTVRSPHAGRVSYLSKREPGEPVRRGEVLAHVGEGPINRILLNTEDFKAHRVKVGQEVRLTSSQSNAMLDGYVRGKITDVDIEKSPADSQSNGTPEWTLETIGHVDSAPVDLVPGTKVTGVIILGHKPIWKILLGLN